jgi:hypothetical protein
MARRLTTNQEIAGSIPASVNFLLLSHLDSHLNAQLWFARSDFCSAPLDPALAGPSRQHRGPA